ncbi:hypothetical protein F6X40_09555 [Paraburkholderia sp. UCT31]|uniref:esterase/lipase family protein n=1 Tax=Paraburkholderia sp. UCT31 TaxID=2615209 RepID=UPI0016550C40|nr:hypothetical protein [Paraburkholderia sp. UCT31]MBC8737054.1 hypothetical protein [Paraburkholderia sp. UCT31]
MPISLGWRRDVRRFAISVLQLRCRFLDGLGPHTFWSIDMKWALVILLAFTQSVFAAEVVDVAHDTRFSPAVANAGMTDAPAFANYGVFLSEPVSRDKEVVVFVHGANASPRDFLDIAGRLDHTRQQAWFVYYASGNPVAYSGQRLAYDIVKLARENGISHIRVVAHSLGGLVAWHIVKTVEDALTVDNFVTIATPFDGNWAAPWGTYLAPHPAASWHDLTPGSDTLQAMWKDKLKAPHTLVYVTTVADDLNASDGTISRESQLEPAIEQSAAHVVKLVGTHVAVLHDPQDVAVIASLIDKP